jgi:hypothetical protein
MKSTTITAAYYSNRHLLESFNPSKLGKNHLEDGSTIGGGKKMTSKITSAKDTAKLSLTLYNGGFGAVKEVRDIQLAGDETELIYADVAQRIETDSLLVEGIEVTEFNYDYDLVDREKLLQKYIGKEIFLKDREKGLRRICRILSVESGGKCVFEDLETQEIYMDTQAELVLPSLPSGLLLQPALVWKIKPQKADKVNVSYLSKGFSWEANYVVELQEEVLKIAGWAKIENDSGSSYENAHIKLIAGEVNRIEEDDFMDKKYLIRPLVMESSVQADEKTFFDYHMYTLLAPTTLKNQQTKQINILSGKRVPYQKYYQLEPREEETSVILAFANRTESGLGIPLPEGKVKVYQADEADGSLEFVGEDKIQHTPKNEDIKLCIGKAFDIQFDYLEKDKRKSGGFEHHLYEVKIRNHKEDAADVRFEHCIWGVWEMVAASQPYIKTQSNCVKFSVMVPADGDLTVSFEYKVDWRTEILLK